MSDKKYLSWSQLNMASRCGAQYEFRYVNGIKIPPDIGLLVGRSVDTSTNKNLTEKKEGRPLLPVEQVKDIARDSFNTEWEKSDVVLSDEEKKKGVKVAKGEGVDKSVRLAGLHGERLAPIIMPTHVQRKVEIELKNFPYDLLCYLDIQEGSYSIRDTKTAAKSKPKDAADIDDQLTIYAMAAMAVDGKIPENLFLDCLIDVTGKWEVEIGGVTYKGEGPKPQILRTERDREDFKPILRRMEAVSRALEAGVFLPANEADWWCDPRWCGYHRICPYVKRSKRPSN